jgi:selenocysteine lyase/cysteine desulfurase
MAMSTGIGFGNWEPDVPDAATTDHVREKDGEHHAVNRRTFTRWLGLGSAAAVFALNDVGRATGAQRGADSGSVPMSRTAPPWPRTGTTDDYLAREGPYFRRIATLFTLDRRVPYMSPGQKGSMPISVMKRLKGGLDQIARDPFPIYLEPSQDTRRKIARSYGAREDEIAISRNATDAISLILSGLDWQPGDEILASTMEYPNCVATLLRVAARFKLTIRQFGIPTSHDSTAQEVVESVRRQIRPGKTRVIFFSCPIQPIGMMMPARRIAALAQEHGITTVIDGAHYGGQFVPRLDEMGIDFWGISGHKWQCGPGGTGILYVRNAALLANPAPLPRFHLVRSGQLDTPLDGSRPEGFDIGAALSVYGFPESADWRALGEVCVLWDRIGRERIQNYTLALADHFRARIARAFGEQALLQPLHDPELLCGIIAFNPFPEAAQRRDAELCARFRERLFAEHGYRIGGEGLGPGGLTRPPDPDAAAFPDGCIPNRDPVTNAPAPTDYPMRINGFIWNQRHDIDRLISACQDVLKTMI